MKHQTYDLRGLDDHTRELIVDNEMYSMLKNATCSICGGGFVGKHEINNAYCVGKHPLQVAHDYCWEGQLNAS
jgi:hypothetical protein